MKFRIEEIIRGKAKMTYCPKYYKLVKGVGSSKYPLVAFDNALRSAGIGDYNLVKVSSIIPPNCKKTEIIDLPKGSVLYAAYASVFTETTMSAKYVAVAIAIPDNKDDNGVIFECTSETDPSDALHEMCHEAMENRNKKDYSYSECIQVLQSKPELYSSAIAAVVLW